MTDVARREATAGSHIGSRTDDKAGTPDRKPLEALKAGAETDSTTTGVHSRGNRTTGPDVARSSQSSSTRSRSRFRDDRRPFHRKPDHRIGSRSKLQQEPKPTPRCRTSLDTDSTKPARRGIWNRRRWKLSKQHQQQERRRWTGTEARSASCIQAGSALGPYSQNQNHQGEGNPEEHSQPIGHGPEVNKGQDAQIEANRRI